jgi:hypothetical protein
MDCFEGGFNASQRCLHSLKKLTKKKHFSLKSVSWPSNEQLKIFGVKSDIIWR